MKKSYLSYPGISLILLMTIICMSCGMSYSHYYFKYPGGVDHEALYHPNVFSKPKTTEPFEKDLLEKETQYPHHSIPPCP